MTNLDRRLEALELLVASLKQRFVWSGAVTPTGPVVLRFRDGTEIALAASSKRGRERALAELVARAKLAPFGVGKKTKVDSRVRDGWAIRAADAGLSVSGLDPEESGILEEVRRALAPRDPAGIVAELYAVNLYGPGGHFATHKDTPRGEGMIGTLVVCLPWQFEGGQLEVVHDKRRVVLDWSEEIRTGTRRLPCAAFFGDVDHRIREVTAGMRVTVSFVLRRAAGSATRAKKTNAKSPATHEGLAGHFAALAADPEVTRGGLALRFPCVHQYAVTPRTPASLSLTKETADSLKGRDAVVARAALDAGLEVSLAYFLWVKDEEGIALDARLDEPPTAKKVGRLRRLVARSHGLMADDLSSETSEPDELPSRVIAYDSKGATHLGGGLYSATGYYGNEASEADYYVGAAIDVTIPTRGAVPARRTVVHPKWGKGEVVGAAADDGERKLRVRFASGEERVLLERFLTFE